MKESSVLGPFHTRLRKRFAGSVVTKHRDASMTGMVDSSFTFQGRTIWFEAKLYPLPKTKKMTPEDWRQKAMEESPAQAEMVKDLYGTSCCVYVIWIKKTCVYVCYPFGEIAVLKDSAQVAERFAIMMGNWKCGEFRPSLFTS